MSEPLLEEKIAIMVLKILEESGGGSLSKNQDVPYVIFDKFLQNLIKELTKIFKKKS